MEEKDKFHNIVKSVLQANELFISQKYLYHFTDINGLYGIIENNQLWLSERNYMNDINDENFIKNYVKNFFGSNDNKQWDNLETDLIPSKHQYIFSTSTENDSIHHWTYYGDKDSFCIEFDREKLIKLFYNFNNKVDYYYGPILYANDVTLNIADKIISEYLQHMCKKEDIFSILNEKNNDEELKEFKRVYQYFYSLIKQLGHSCENEYRFLLQRNDTPKFRVNKGLFVPYITVPKDKTKDKLPINRIFIGPNSYENYAKENLQYFLKEKGYSSVSIDKSKMNVRK